MLSRWLTKSRYQAESALSWVQIIAAVLALIGSPFAVWQYFEARNEQRVVRTLAEVRRFDESPLAEQQEAVSALASQARQVFLKRTNNGSQAGFTEAGWKRLGDQVMIETSYGGDLANGRLSEGVRKVVGFYETLQVCIDQKACDRKTAHAYLDDYVAAFWQNFYPLILHERAGQRPGFAKGMERFHGQREKAP